MTTTPETTTMAAPAGNPGAVFGYHLRINLAGCQLSKIRRGPEILSWAQLMVSPEGIDMTQHDEPWMDHFGPEPGKIGWTLFLPITESNILIHANDDGTAFIDIFSCKWFDPDKALKLTVAFFNPRAVDHDFKPRRAPQER